MYYWISRAFPKKGSKVTKNRAGGVAGVQGLPSKHIELSSNFKKKLLKITTTQIFHKVYKILIERTDNREVD
jgi:hypothetical protein